MTVLGPGLPIGASASRFTSPHSLGPSKLARIDRPGTPAPRLAIGLPRAVASMRAMRASCWGRCRTSFAYAAAAMPSAALAMGCTLSAYHADGLALRRKLHDVLAMPADGVVPRGLSTLLHLPEESV